MKMVIVSVFDAKMEAFGRPFFVPTEGAAMRSFLDEVNRIADDNPMAKHPDDYQLFHLGYFDDADGKFSNVTPPKLLVQGAAVKEVSSKVVLIDKVSKV